MKPAILIYLTIFKRNWITWKKSADVLPYSIIFNRYFIITKIGTDDILCIEIKELNLLPYRKVSWSSLLKRHVLSHEYKNQGFIVLPNYEWFFAGNVIWNRFSLASPLTYIISMLHFWTLSFCRKKTFYGYLSLKNCWGQNGSRL
jgi:hypothetical protein